MEQRTGIEALMLKCGLGIPPQAGAPLMLPARPVFLWEGCYRQESRRARMALPRWADDTAVRIRFLLARGNQLFPSARPTEQKRPDGSQNGVWGPLYDKPTYRELAASLSDCRLAKCSARSSIFKPTAGAL